MIYLGYSANAPISEIVLDRFVKNRATVYRIA